ncbi:MAG: sulfurtransferase TusA family protein [Frankia sp.]
MTPGPTPGDRAGRENPAGPTGAAVVVDARGRPCPVPIIELAKAARDLTAGTIIEVLADDPAAAADVPAWCRMRGHEYLSAEPLPDGSGTAYRVRRA